MALGSWLPRSVRSPLHATPSPLSAGSQSDAYRKASAAGCSPCESSPAATLLGEPGTRDSGNELPATPKGGRRGPTACPCLGLPGHIPTVPCSVSPRCSPLASSGIPAGAPDAALMLQPCQPPLHFSVQPCWPVCIPWYIIPYHLCRVSQCIPA